MQSAGQVKWFDDGKGYGFIKPDDEGKDVFVHHSAIRMDGHRSLVEGQRVMYDTQQTEKGLSAVDVTVIGE